MLMQVNLLEAQKKTSTKSQAPAATSAFPLPPPPPPMAMDDFVPPPPPPIPISATNQSALNAAVTTKSVKTVKLHWREAKTEYVSAGGSSLDTIWTQVMRDIGDVQIDTNKLEHLFELRTTELNGKVRSKQDGLRKTITVLDAKRSNMINIGLTTLPIAKNIKLAILSMDSSVLSREGIEVCCILLVLVSMYIVVNAELLK